MDPRSKTMRRENDKATAQDARRAQLLERGVSLSRTAAELRRAAWDARRARPAT